MRKPLIDRFWPKVRRGGPHECWEWTANLVGGYGHIRDANWRTVKAHRVAWALHNGRIPPGMSVCHRCDNTKCCNPAHLFLGTPKDNTDDMIRKGRAAPQKGQNNGGAKLTDEQVLAILPMHGKATAVELAKAYGVSRSTISDIWRGLTWTHLTGPAHQKVKDFTSVSVTREELAEALRDALKMLRDADTSLGVPDMPREDALLARYDAEKEKKP